MGNGAGQADRGVRFDNRERNVARTPLPFAFLGSEDVLD